MYSFSDLEPVCCSMSSSNCCFLTCIQISPDAGQVVWYSHLFQNFPLFIVIHTVKGFGIINKAEVNIFLELSCFFDDPTDVGNSISGSSAFSKIHIECLEVHGSHTVEAWLGEFWALLCWHVTWLIQTCLCVSSSLQQRYGSVVACCSVRGTEWSSACRRPFEVGRHYLHLRSLVFNWLYL